MSQMFKIIKTERTCGRFENTVPEKAVDRNYPNAFTSHLAASQRSHSRFTIRSCDRLFKRSKGTCSRISSPLRIQKTTMSIRTETGK